MSIKHVNKIQQELFCNILHFNNILLGLKLPVLKKKISVMKVAILFDSKTFPKKIKTYQDSRSHQDCLEYKTWISASFNN